MGQKNIFTCFVWFCGKRRRRNMQRDMRTAGGFSDLWSKTYGMIMS